MRTLAFVLFVLLINVRAEARPVYAIETGKPCAYCHVNPKGGGPRNPRGLYFAANKHSFRGYDELKVMGRFSPPLLVEEWKETVPASVRKVGVGDTVGDGATRLITLSEGSPSTRVIEIRKWDGKSWATEFKKEIPGSSDRLAVGKYAGSDKPAVVVSSGALVYREGPEYRVLPAPRPIAVLGTVQLKTGAERLLVNEASTLKMYRIDPAKGEAWLTGGLDPPMNSAETSFTDMKAPTAELQAIGMPDILAAGEIIGLWDARKSDAVFFYAVKLVAVVESRSEAQAKSIEDAAKNLVLKGQTYHVTIVDPRSPNLKTLWQSRALNGRVHDVTLNDARSSERGITILTDSEEGKSKTLSFYKLL